MWQGGMDLPRSVMRVRLRLSLVSWLQPTRPLRTTESPTRVQANPNTWGRHISDGCLIDFNRRIRNLFPPTRGSSGRSYLEVGQAGDECGDAPAGDGRAVQTQLLELPEAPQGGQAGVRQPRVAKRQLLQAAGRDSRRLRGR